MSMHEIPMIIFTLFAQMAVGAFVVLGLIQVSAKLSGKYTDAEIDKMTDPAAYAAGATLVAGLAASMLHMNDIFNVFNVFRGVGSSWLSREIVAGIFFAGAGFLFAAAQYFKYGTARLRRWLAAITAVLGVVLVFVMSMIYYSLPTVPAWHTINTPFRFYMTTAMLGLFAVGTGLMFAANREAQHTGTLEPKVADLVFKSQRGIAIAGITVLGLNMIATPMHSASLVDAGATHSAAVMGGDIMAVRIALLFVGAGLLGLFLFKHSSTDKADRVKVTMTVTAAFVIVFISEFLGRAMFYESMQRIGM